MWYSFGNCSDDPAGGARCALLQPFPAYPLTDALFAEHADHIARSTRFPYQRISSKRESCRNTSDYRTPSAKGQSRVRPPKLRSASLEVSCFLDPLPVSSGIWPEKRPNHLAIGLLFIKGQHAGRDPECVVRIPPARKEAASKRWCSQPGVLLPSPGRFFRRPVTGHQTEGPLPPKRPFLASEAALLLIRTGLSAK